MPEWQIIIDSDDFPEPSPEEPPQRPRFHSRWLVVVGVILALLLAGILSFYRQHTQALNTLEQDLTAAIFEEETVRHFGNPEQADDLITPNVPDNWRQTYTGTFSQSLQSPPNSIEITDIEFGGVCAIVDVKLDNDKKTRVYCLDDEKWKRAAITPGVWGLEDTILNLDNGITLRFFPRDQQFAENLARDLNGFFKALNQWGIQTNPGQLPKEITIQPFELLPPLINNNDQQIVLNSPLAAQATALPGSVVVRLALTQAILARILPVSPEDMQDLPGASRLLAAAYTSLGARTLLTEEEQQDLAQIRQKDIGNEWISPFYADFISPDETQESEARAAAAYLLTEYIVSQEGPEALITLIQRLPAANSWDGIFESIVGRTTIALENETAGFFQYPPAYSDVGRKPDTPLPATLDRYITDGAMVTLLHQTKPVWVEFSPQQTAQTSNGLSIPMSCIPPHAELLLEGEWLEIQRRFAATKITLPHDIALFPTSQIPTDTTAYLKTDESLMALNEDGTLLPLVNLDPSLQMVPLPVAVGDSPHFLFSLNLPLCERIWFAHYRPDQGIINQWLSPPTPMTWAWRLDQNDLLFFKLEDESGQTIYQTGNNQSLQPVSQAEIPVDFLGWNDKSQQLVFHSPWMGFTYLGLIEPDTGVVNDLQMYLDPIQFYTLSPDGQWLIFLPEPDSMNTSSQQLRLFDVDTLKSTKFVEILSDEKIGPTTWSLYLDRPQIAVLFAPLHGVDAMRLQRLAIAVPDQPGTLTTVVQVDHGQRLSSPVFCSDGSLLYQVETNSQYQLKRWNPDHAPQTLLTLDQPFQAMACS